MKSGTFLALLLSAAACTSGTAIAQNFDRSHTQQPAPTYRDPQTGELREMTRVEPDATYNPTTGTITVTLNFTVKTQFPMGANPTFLCGSHLAATSLNTTADTYILSEEDAWTRGFYSSGTGSCTVKIPYSWRLPAASATIKNSLSATYDVKIVNGYGTATAEELRYSTASSLTGAIPPTGSMTQVTLNIVL